MIVVAGIRENDLDKDAGGFEIETRDLEGLEIGLKSKFQISKILFREVAEDHPVGRLDPISSRRHPRLREVL